MGTTTYTPRQIRAFSQRFDIYKPVEIATVGKLAEGWHHGESPVATNVRGRIMGKSEASAIIEGAQRVGRDQMDTTDVIRLPIQIYGDDGTELRIAENWVIKLASGGYTENAAHYVVSGEAYQLTHRARERKHFLKRSVQSGGRPA